MKTIILIDDTYGFDSEVRTYDAYCPTLRSERSGIKVMEIEYEQQETDETPKR